MVPRVGFLRRESALLWNLCFFSQIGGETVSHNFPNLNFALNWCDRVGALKRVVWASGIVVL